MQKVEGMIWQVRKHQKQGFLIFILAPSCFLHETFIPVKSTYVFTDISFSTTRVMKRCRKINFYVIWNISFIIFFLSVVIYFLFAWILVFCVTTLFSINLYLVKSVKLPSAMFNGWLKELMQIEGKMCFWKKSFSIWLFTFIESTM